MALSKGGPMYRANPIAKDGWQSEWPQMNLTSEGYYLWQWHGITGALEWVGQLLERERKGYTSLAFDAVKAFVIDKLEVMLIMENGSMKWYT